MSTTEQTPMTWPQIRDALEAIAPTVTEDGPVDARALARTMAVAAQRRWNRNLSRYFAAQDEATRRLFTESVNAMCAEFAMIHLLVAFMDENPVRAGELATQIRDAWDDGGSIGEWLWEHEQALGIDADAVNRLEDAWQALPRHARALPDALPDDLAEVRAKLTQADEMIRRLTRITTAWTRGMYSARIDCWRGDPEAAAACLSEGLDGYDGPEWDGTETGAEWWERTKAEEGL